MGLCVRPLQSAAHNSTASAHLSLSLYSPSSLCAPALRRRRGRSASRAPPVVTRTRDQTRDTCPDTWSASFRIARHLPWRTCESDQYRELICCASPMALWRRAPRPASAAGAGTRGRGEWVTCLWGEEGVPWSGPTPVPRVPPVPPVPWYLPQATRTLPECLSGHLDEPPPPHFGVPHIIFLPRRGCRPRG